MSMQNKTSSAQTQTPEKKKDAQQPDPGLASPPDDNVDQDGNCIMPAYGEAVGPNSGGPCDDGRSGGK